MTQITRRQLVATALLSAMLPAWAQPAGYPDGRPIKLVVPYTPGGGTDTVARFIAARISAETRWSMIVENRPGAAGNIGMDIVAKAKPDGLMVGLGQTANLAINPALMPRMPFDAEKDLVPVALVASQPVVLVVRADSPWKSLGEAIKAAQAKPGEFKQALAGNGTVGHLAGEMLANRAQFKVLNVPYKGAGPAVNDLLGGSTDFMFATPQSVLEMLKGKRLRALAVTSAKRLPVLPDVPTVAESGYAGFEAVDWKVLVAPAGTPATIVQALNAANEKVLSKPETIALLATEGSTALGGSAAKARQYIQAEQRKWARLIKDANITLE
ncbi:MAG: tripartite tricarboxylate transporter substrate binding protein [Comamonas sp.]